MMNEELICKKIDGVHYTVLTTSAVLFGFVALYFGERLPNGIGRYVMLAMVLVCVGMAALTVLAELRTQREIKLIEGRNV